MRSGLAVLGGRVIAGGRPGVTSRTIRHDGDIGLLSASSPGGNGQGNDDTGTITRLRSIASA